MATAENQDGGADSQSLVRVIGNVEGQADNQFSQPRGVCVDPRSKTVFVIDNNNHRIQLYNLRSLAYIRTIPSNTQASPFFGNMGRPKPSAEPTIDQLSCLKALVDNNRNPYGH